MRQRTKASSQADPPPSIVDSQPLGWPWTTPDRRVAVVSVAVRNAVAIIGVLFLGWSAPELVLLYFLDTMAAIWGIFTAVAFGLYHRQRQSLFDLVYWWATALALSFLVAAFIAIPLGMPVLFVAAASSWRLADALAESGFRLALVGIVVLGVVGALARSIQAAAGEAAKRSLKWEFSLVFGRWAVILMAIYAAIALFQGAAAVVIVIVYAVVSVTIELYPQRFVELFGNGRGRRSS